MSEGYLSISYFKGNWIWIKKYGINLVDNLIYCITAYFHLKPSVGVSSGIYS